MVKEKKVGQEIQIESGNVNILMIKLLNDISIKLGVLIDQGKKK